MNTIQDGEDEKFSDFRNIMIKIKKYGDSGSYLKASSQNLVSCATSRRAAAKT